MSLLADREKKLLLQVARQAIALAAQAGASLANLPDHETLMQPGGAFVTLRRRLKLRGCIGQMPSDAPLIRVVAHCARAAALEDPRFQALQAEEVPEIDIELSVLSALQDVAASEVQPGLHGLMISRGWQRGVLLPQVATEFQWTADRFLEETCLKAGFDRSAWKDSATRIQVFTAEIFSESGLPMGSPSGRF